MRKKFWYWVHDRLESAWHWVYYHKLAEPLPKCYEENYRYSVHYVDGKGNVTEPSPIVEWRE